MQDSFRRTLSSVSLLWDITHVLPPVSRCPLVWDQLITEEINRSPIFLQESKEDWVCVLTSGLSSILTRIVISEDLSKWSNIALQYSYSVFVTSLDGTANYNVLKQFCRWNIIGRSDRALILNVFNMDRANCIVLTYVTRLRHTTISMISALISSRSGHISIE